jgi:hypothetical protein
MREATLGANIRAAIVYGGVCERGVIGGVRKKKESGEAGVERIRLSVVCPKEFQRRKGWKRKLRKEGKFFKREDRLSSGGLRSFTSLVKAWLLVQR